MASSQAEPVKSSAPPVPFSYAQAARGASSTTSNQSSKTPSGAITPAKEQNVSSLLKSELNGTKWADSVDEEVKDSSTHSSASTAVDGLSVSSVRSSTQTNGIASPSSVDFGTSSTSTLVREDGPSPMSEVPESNWEARNNPISKLDSKPRGSTDRASSRGRKKSGRKPEKKEKGDESPSASKPIWTAPIKFTEAPMPTVNVWQLRAQQTKSTPTSSPSSNPTTGSTSTTKPVANANAENATTPKAYRAPIPSITSPRTEHNPPSSKTPSDTPSPTAPESHESPKDGAATEKLEQTSTSSVNRESWPTPVLAQGEEPRKKPQDKTESEVNGIHAPKGKGAWEKMEFTPSVVFNTPLPGQARRGGRGGSRGGRETSGGRAAPAGEKRSESGTVSQAPDATRRDRAEMPRNSSPNRTKRDSNDESSTRRGSRQESVPRKAFAENAEEARTKSAEGGDQSGVRTTQGPKPRGNRKDWANTNGERRKDEQAPSRTADTSMEGKTTIAGASTQDSKVSTQVNPSQHDGSPSRKASASTEGLSRTQDRKNGSYSSHTGRDRPERGRGGHRGGRNGSHGFHPPPHAFMSNAVGAAFGMPHYNNLPRSPTGFGNDPFFGQSPQHAQRYSRGYPTRASSIPVEHAYPRIGSGYPAHSLQINTGVQNGVYPPDFYMPATAVPYQNDVASNLLSAVSTQMEYYFSVNNLIKDTFLRKYMDGQGFVHLSLIADFKRLKSMTDDLEVIKYVCQQSPNIEHRVGADGIDRLRVAKGWEQWVLPLADRDQSAQNNGPESVHQPPKPTPQFMGEQPHLSRHSSLPVPQSAGPVLGSQGFQSLNSVASTYSYTPNNSIDTTPVPHFQSSPTSMASPKTMSQQQPPPFAGPSSQIPFTTNGIEETEPDTFTDPEVEALKLVVKDLDVDDAETDKVHRTLSNGSTDAVNGLRAADSSSAAPSDLDSRASPTTSDRVNRFLAGGSRLAGVGSHTRSVTSHDSEPIDASNVYWIKDRDQPEKTLPPGATDDLYLTIRDRALNQRAYHACPHDMNVLYNFWEHFLVRNFNARMYNEFRFYAMEDASTRTSFSGLNSLLKYYGKALSHEVPIRRSVAQDYVNLVRSEPREFDRPAFKQLRAAWRDGALNMKNRKRIKDFIDRDLEAELDR